MYPLLKWCAGYLLELPGNHEFCRVFSGVFAGFLLRMDVKDLGICWIFAAPEYSSYLIPHGEKLSQNKPTNFRHLPAVISQNPVIVYAKSSKYPATNQ